MATAHAQKRTVKYAQPSISCRKWSPFVVSAFAEDLCSYRLRRVHPEPLRSPRGALVSSSHEASTTATISPSNP